MRVVLVDHHDSFTYNLFQQIARLGADIEVVVHDAVTVPELLARGPDRIVLSPGPGHPGGTGVTRDLIRACAGRVPILGVCLGHQCLADVFGVSVVRAPRPCHGKTSPIHHRGRGLFQGLSNPFRAMRYHSLVIPSVPPGFTLEAWTGDGLIMAIAHEELPLFGVQFHPESFMTEEGERLLERFLALRWVPPVRRPSPPTGSPSASPGPESG